MTPATTNATTAVLTDFDLVEDIILRLPIREVLLTKGVCKAWKNVHNESTRVQKALFLMPATEQKIYYPSVKEPTWYLSPARSELIDAGLVSEAVEHSDGDITPTNSPKLTAHVKPAGEKNTVGSAQSEGATKGKRNTNFHFTTFGEHESVDDETDGKVLVDPKAVSETHGHPPVSHGDQAVGGMHAAGGIGASDKNIRKTVLRYKRNEKTSIKNMKLLKPTSNINIFGQMVNAMTDFNLDEDPEPHTPDKTGSDRLKIPPSPDGKMMVSRVTSPFINPFCELFIERYYRGSRGGYHAINTDYSPGKDLPQLVVRPQIKLADGTTRGSSKKTRAVQRNDASWRKMHPFSALTASIEVECYDNGAFEAYCDWGMLAGSMMDQLGEHWANICPDCCIVDYWFSEFIKPVCSTDNSHWNRGDHGVKKLGLDNTGWEILAKLADGKIQTTGVKDRIRPF